jgi:hypothetical protein
MSKLYVASMRVLIQSPVLGDKRAQGINWSEVKTYKFADANDREAFVERVAKANVGLKEELGLTSDVFQLVGRATEHAQSTDEAVTDCINVFAHRHEVYERHYDQRCYDGMR